MLRRQTKRALLAVVTAGGSSLLAIGVLGTGVAQGASAGTHNPVVYTTSQAGYVAQGTSFRFVSTTFKVPKAYADSYAEVVLGGHHITPASLGVRAGGGSNSVRWNAVGPLGEQMAGGALKIAPKVGDLVTESIYFSPKHIVYFTVADLTQHKTVTLGVPAGSTKYTAAEVACWLPNTVRAPKADVRLWQFTDSRATTFAGVGGTMIGPWTTSKIVDVTHTGRVVMSPSVLWKHGHNFGAWLRATR
jgi:Peptidase A4 family